LKISNEVKIGLTVLVAFIITLIGFRFMRDVPIFSQAKILETTFQRVNGLTEGSIVYLNGVKVGSVSRIELMPNDSVRVIMNMERLEGIPKGTIAQLTSLSLIEGKSIVLAKGDSPEIVDSGQRIKGVYVDSIIEVLSEKGEDLGQDLSATFTELNAFLNKLNDTINEGTKKNFNETFSNAAKATGTLANMLQEKQVEIDKAIDAASRTMQQIDTLTSNNRGRVDSLLTHLETNMKEIEVTRRNLDQSLESLNELLERVNNGDGTFGKLVNDSSLYNNTDSLAVEMKKLMKEFNENPRKFLKHMNIIEVF